jgi:hypothetical protein
VLFQGFFRATLGHLPYRISRIEAQVAHIEPLLAAELCKGYSQCIEEVVGGTEQLVDEAGVGVLSEHYRDDVNLTEGTERGGRGEDSQETPEKRERERERERDLAVQNPK